MAERQLIIYIPADSDPAAEGVRALQLLAGDLYDAHVTYRDSREPTLELRGKWLDTPDEVAQALSGRLAKVFPELTFTARHGTQTLFG